MTNQPPVSGRKSRESATPKQRITPRALLEAKRISDPQIHPDGLRVAFVVEEADFDNSRWVSHLWLTEWVESEGEEDLIAGTEEEETALTEALKPKRDSDENKTPPALDADKASVCEPDDFTRQLTYSYEGEFDPQWSPDGETLAFLSSRPDPAASEDDDDGTLQIWTLPVDGGEAKKITSAKEGVLGYEWSPNSASFFYLTSESYPKPVESARKDQRRKYIDPTVEMEDKLRRQIWRMDAEDGKPQLILNGDFGIDDFSLSPDGSALCFLTNYSGDPDESHISDLYRFQMETGTVTKLVQRMGAKYSLRWSPDGTRIAFLSGFDPDLSYSQTSLYVLDSGISGIPVESDPENASHDLKPALSPAPFLPLKPDETYGLTAPGSAICELYTDLDYDMGGYDWLRTETGGIAILASVGAGSQLFFINEGDAKPVFETGGERGGLSVSKEEVAYAWIEENEKELPEVFLRDAKGVSHQLTRLNSSFAKSYRLPRQEIVRWKSDDALEIEGLLTYPVDWKEGERYPLILQVHGGPNSRCANTLRDYYQHPVWASEGYLVLRPNFRGSEGYGKDFSVANRRDFGGGDYRDIITGADWCIAQGLADANRIGIMGGSYGGYMTNWAISQTDRFKAAISLFGIFTLQTDFSNSASSRWELDYLGATWWDDPEVYARLSPGSYVRNIKTPTLIIHGDDDDNTFISNSKEMYRALKLRGVTTQFVHYPREGHGVREPNHKLDEMRRCVAWMDRHLLYSGEVQKVWRLGDRIKSNDERLELMVTKVEIPSFLGASLSPEETKESQETLLEVTFTLTGRQTSPEASAFSLADIKLETLEGEKNFTPIGIPLEAPGGKMLIEGDSLRTVQRPDPKTGQLAFALSVVYRIPKYPCEGMLQIVGFPPVLLIWSLESEGEEEAKSTDDSETPNKEHTLGTPVQETLNWEEN